MVKNISLHKTSLCGLRPSNEDAEGYKMNLTSDGNPKNPNLAPIDFFVVCDGHGGSEVAKFVVPILEKQIMMKNNSFPLPYGYIKEIYNNIQDSLIKHPKKIANACGCTALVVIRYLDEKGYPNIQVINIGDSRAVLCRSGLAIPLCKDHKPFWSDEKRRIDYVNKKYNKNLQIHYDAGDWRIGDLSVSRAFGDLDNTPHVTHIPESFNYQLIPEDEFIVLGCDGLFDQLQNHEIINFVRDHYNNNNTELYDIADKYPTDEIIQTKNIARKLAEFAICSGSTDNVSILIVFLK